MANLQELLDATCASRLLNTVVTTLSTVPHLFVNLADARSKLWLLNISASTITIGNNSITAGSGWLVNPGAQLQLPVGKDVQVYGCAPAASPVVQLEMV